MDGKTFHEKFHKVFDENPGKKMIGNVGETIKGTFPVMVELHKANIANIELTSGELSTKLDISTARIAVILNCLEEKGIVERYKNESDARKTYIRLTQKGVDEFEKGKLCMENRFTEALKGIDDGDIDIFFNVVDQILKNLNKGVEQECSNCTKD